MGQPVLQHHYLYVLKYAQKGLFMHKICAILLLMSEN
jgi:hypothetical protein